MVNACWAAVTMTQDMENHLNQTGTARPTGGYRDKHPDSFAPIVPNSVTLLRTREPKERWLRSNQLRLAPPQLLAKSAEQLPDRQMADVRRGCGRHAPICVLSTR
jgi:hypothetical protein